MGNMTALHRWSIAAIVATGLCILILNLAVGALKPAADIAWLDIAGEGGAALPVSYTHLTLPTKA